MEIPRRIKEGMILHTLEIDPEDVKVEIGSDGEKKEVLRIPYPDIGYPSKGDVDDAILSVMGYTSEDLPEAQ